MSVGHSKTNENNISIAPMLGKSNLKAELVPQRVTFVSLKQLLSRDSDATFHSNQQQRPVRSGVDHFCLKDSAVEAQRLWRLKPPIPPAQQDTADVLPVYTHQQVGDCVPSDRGGAQHVASEVQSLEEAEGPPGPDEDLHGTNRRYKHLETPKQREGGASGLTWLDAIRNCCSPTVKCFTPSGSTAKVCT